MSCIWLHNNWSFNWVFVFANFTAYPFKKALGIIFQVLKTLLNLQSSIGHWVEIKGRETIFFFNKYFGIFKVITVLFFFRHDNKISLYYIVSQGIWKYLWTILSSFFLNGHRRRRNYLSNGYNRGTTAKLTCPKIKMEWINYQKLLKYSS